MSIKKIKAEARKIAIVVVDILTKIVEGDARDSLKELEVDIRSLSRCRFSSRPALEGVAHPHQGRVTIGRRSPDLQLGMWPEISDFLAGHKNLEADYYLIEPTVSSSLS